jgi:hypothetical protein
MLTLSSSWTPDVLTESLATLARVLQSGMGSRASAFVPQTARGATGQFLWMLRDHLRVKGLLKSALSEVDPRCLPRILEIEREHRLLKHLSHVLCSRIRTADREAAGDVTHRLLAILIDHMAHERRVLTELVANLDPARTRRFGDLLFDQLIRGAGKDGLAVHSPASVPDLHSLTVRLLGHLRTSSPIPPEARYVHEHSRN